ncbi:IS3 family transposase [Mycolicibacterium fallax]|uniref:IS3 family transposase n=1 Tax=Mycolicibacterium fallax TaxID=1793 RepID=UPI000D6C0947|nr:IS3 family transposase [Mycolicibacterium fallax]
MVADLRSDTTSEWEAMGRVADLLGVGTAETVRKWVRQAEIDAGQRAGQTTGESEVLRKLRRENAELKRANAILKAASGFLRRRTRPALSVVVEFISAHQHQRVGADGLKWGVESMCAVLSEFGVTIAPSTYYAHRARCGPSKADWVDAQVIDAIYRLRRSNPLYRVLGARKTWIVLRTNGLDVSRCAVERVMREMGWRGACKRRRVRTTIADPAATRAPDRVQRRFVAQAPDRLWVADFTYCRTRAGWAYTAFVTDVYARKIVGWKVATEMTQRLVTDAINHAIDARKRSGTTDLESLIHHSDAGSQYTAIAFTERLAAEGILPSVGSVGDSFDNALAESVNSSYKTELIDHQPLYPGATELSLATAEWVAFYNRRRPNGYCQDLTPDRAEALYYHRQRHPQTEEALR